MRNVFSLLLATLMLLAVGTCLADVPNNGEDVTRPVTRIDLRAKGQVGVDKIDGKDIILTLRSDMAINLPHKWQLGLRADAPVEFFYCSCKGDACANDCKNARHMGDSLFQIFLITPDYNRWTFGIGAKAIFPTGGKNLAIGDGKYRILPSFAFKYDLHNVSEGSYVGAILRQDWSYAGYASVPKVLRSYIQPSFNWNLPLGWFINSAPEIIYNGYTHRWFVPFDLMIGKMITSKLVVSLEYETALVYAYPQYRSQLEFRLGFFF